MQDDDGRQRDAEEIGFRHRLRYRFDNLLARGTWAALLLLGVVTLVTVVLSGLLLRLFGVTFTENQDVGWLEDSWQSLLRALDTGTMAGDIGWGRRILSLAVTLFGVLVAGTLIGILAAGVEDRITSMRRGRSVVIETNHVVVLGPPDRVAPVVRELIRSGAGANGGIVVMAEGDPADMRTEVRRIVDVPRENRLVFRSGDPTRTADLELVRLGAARTIIVVGDVDDTFAVRTTLALLTATTTSAVPVIVETRDAATASSLTEAGAPRVHALASEYSLARLAAYAVARPGMAGVVAELTDPRSADLQVRADPAATGMTFRELVLRSNGARPLGRFRTDGSLELNPPPDAVITDGERLVYLALTDAVPTFERGAEVTPPPRHDPPPDPVTIEHLVVLGWSPLATLLVQNWAQIASDGSTLEIVAAPGDLPSPDALEQFRGVSVVTTPGDIDEVIALGDGSRRPTVILLPAAGDPDSGAETDSATILRLITLRRRLRELGSDARLMVELSDPESTDLLPPMSADDHVMSRELAAQLLVQLAEQPARRAILGSLYAPARPSLRLVSAASIGLVGDHDMDEVVTACESYGLLAIGWRRAGDVALDPPLGARVQLEDHDQIVVID